MGGPPGGGPPQMGGPPGGGPPQMGGPPGGGPPSVATLPTGGGAPPPSKAKQMAQSRVAHGADGTFAPGMAPPGPSGVAPPANVAAPVLYEVPKAMNDAMGGNANWAPPANTAAAPLNVGISSEPAVTNFQKLEVTGGPGNAPNPATCPRPLTFQRGDQAEDARGPSNCKMMPNTEPGQCDPKLFRVTTNAIPATNALKQKWGLPFGAVIHPMAEMPGHGVPVVNFGNSGIIRCRRCRTYINPFVQFVQGGQRWKCNVCGLINDVPPEYFCVLDANGRRRDLAERPELCHGHVEFVAPAEYMVRPPQPPVYFFVIDVSYNAVASGMLQSAVNAIQATLQSLNGAHTGDRTQVGFLTFDSALHFYNLKPTLSRPQMLVVTDVAEVYTPLNEGLLVDLAEAEDVVMSLVESLPEMFASTSNTQSCLGPALQGAYMVMQKMGGKMLVFQTTMPNLGVGKLRNRDNPRVMGTDKERSLMQPEELFYKRLGVECSRNQICVDMFVGASGFMDIASMAPLPKFTGGQLNYFAAFRADKDGPELESVVKRVLTRETGWEAVMRVRCSRGLKVSSFYGHFFIRSTDLLALPNIDSDKAFAVQFSHEEGNLQGRTCCFQVALLYTSSIGERRIRVLTSQLPVVSTVGEMYQYADAGAAINLMQRIAIEQALNSRMVDACNMMQTKCIEVLKMYRGLVGHGAGNTNIVYPEALRLLPLYTLALLKQQIFHTKGDVPFDLRASLISRAETLSVPLSTAATYAHAFKIDSLGPEVGTEQNGQVVVPGIVPLSISCFDPAGAYLIDNGLRIYVWLGSKVPETFFTQTLSCAPPRDAATFAALKLPEGAPAECVPLHRSIPC